MSASRVLASSLLALLIAGPASLGAFPRRALISGVPHMLQKPDYCGEACVSMALAKHAISVSQDEVFVKSELSPILGRGCWTRDLYKALVNLKVPTPSPWIELPADRAAKLAVMQRTWDGIKEEIARGTPAIVCTRYDLRADSPEHFRLVVGYDADQRTVTFHDPAIQDGAYKTMALETFVALWPLKDGKSGSFLVRFFVPPPATASRAMEFRPEGVPQENPPAAHESSGPVYRAGPTFDVDGARDAIARRLPEMLGPEFRVTREGPFAIAGNLSPDELESYQTGTIRWAYRHLSREFFDERPLDHPITVYLFRDAASYETNATRLFGEAPGTPYGYYLPSHEALVMNISTGGGTLVHEMVHPLLACDFPRAPSWLNEGMGSLFEQCGEKGGSIVGFTNWRLPGLQQSIAGGRPPSLRRLMSTSRSEFYGALSGSNYAAARYLLHWLQERGLLHEYYRRFRVGVATDPTGIATLEAVTGRKLEELQPDWERHVMSLTFT